MMGTSAPVDIIFLVGPDQKRPFTSTAHRSVLAASSPVFNKMVYGLLSERCEGPVRVPDIDRHTFEELLR